MKTKHLFSKALSAVLVLFGFSSFAWADGACPGSGYDCIDLSSFDNNHPAATSIVGGEEKQANEIPNSGIIPSNPNGNSLGTVRKGYIKSGGTLGTDNLTNLDRVQLVEFNNLNVTDINNQDNGLKRRFGGHGTYVFGDVVTTAASVIQSMPGDVITGSPTWPGGYINNGGISGAKNSATSKIKLPKGVKKEDIVFARLYWMGHLYPQGQMGSAGEKITTTQVEIPAIAGYQNVKLKIAGSEVYDITRQNCQGTFAFTNKRINNEAIGGPRYNMNYTCSAEITDHVKNNFTDYDDEISITVGDINAAKENPHYGNGKYGGNMVWQRGMATVKKDPMNAWVTTNTTYRLPFGGWYVVLVYDKTLKSQAELQGLDFTTYDGDTKTPDDVKYQLARRIGISGDPKEYIKSHFAAKMLLCMTDTWR